MASNQNIKNALSFPAEAENPITDVARTVGNDALTRFATALGAEYRLGRAANADDAARWLYRQARGLVVKHERRVAEQGLPQPADLEN